MHSVPRSPEPEFLPSLRAIRSEYAQLEDMERRQVRGALAQDFSRVCGYCEQSCVETSRRERDNEESIDHFHPRESFPDESLDWLNLIYACRRCNQSKASKWPTVGDYDNQRLASITRYQQVSEYVCPNQYGDEPLCESLFDYNLATGEIEPASDVDDKYWSMAYRTIADIDLNSVFPSYQNLPELRQQQIELLEITLDETNDSELKSVIVAGFCRRNQPFSSFASTYAKTNGFAL